MNRKPKMIKYTLKQFQAQFPTDAVCLEWLFRYFYPNGTVFCNKCQKDTKHHRVASRPSYSCDYCGHHVHPTADTIFHKSPTPLTTWFYAVYLMASTRCGISAKQIERETGVTYKTAWRMFKQIRSMLEEGINPLGGPESKGVEMDESYFGPKRKRGGKRGRPGPDSPKQCVIGVVERKGRVVALTSDNATRANLHSIAQERILPASTVFTDEWTGYHGLDSKGYQHKRINHAEKIYVTWDGTDKIHTQTIDGFWSLAKNGIRGVYHNVGKHYLQTYLNEYSFRYNRRFDEQPMFTSFMNQIEKRDAVIRSTPIPVEVEPF
ncbi:MAG TPA: IS1595 family transposase [Candidatus Angelobacter sp.]|jgi:transposase-like protein|nr:IS1595 family transposase [Candidatus Angelobacter sp.]